MGVINQLNYHKCAINPIKSTISYGFLWSNGGTTSKTYKNDGTNPVDPMDPKASCVGGSHHVQSAGHLTKRTTFGPQNDRMLRSHSYIKTNHGHTHMYMCIYIYKCICIYICNICIHVYYVFIFFPLQMSFHVVSTARRRGFGICQGAGAIGIVCWSRLCC